MTEAQTQAAERILEIMREHFSAGVIVVCAETEDEKSDAVRCFWHGGFPSAIGLLELGKRHTIDSRETEL
jgi:hypothetical protein